MESIIKEVLGISKLFYEGWNGQNFLTQKNELKQSNIAISAKRKF